MLFTREMLQDEKDRSLVEKILAGKVWKMRLKHVNQDFAFLAHSDFKPKVFFPFNSFGIDHRDLAKECNVEVMISYDQTKKEYSYAVKCLISADSAQNTTAAVLENQNTPTICSQKISDLKPSRFWDVLIDETGSGFKNSMQVSSLDSSGKFVALLVPAETNLPPLPEGWHAVKRPFFEVSSVIRTLQSSNCGIMGISVTDLPKLQGELWFVGLRKLIDLILLLIPCEGKTTLHLLVEEHVDDKHDMTLQLQQTCRDAQLQFSKYAPEKAELVDVVPKVISKTDDPRNGYVDAIAYAWGSPSNETKALIQDWIGSCLWAGTSNRIIEYMTSQKFPRAGDWSELIAASVNSPNNSFVINYLELLSKEIAHSKEDWINYLNETRKHLESKSINQKLLDAQVKWLKASKPEEVEITPPLQLLWMTSELADANHVGKILDDEFLEDFIPLCEDLADEDASLVAWADLNLSVAYTNAFDFENARNVMARWQGVLPGHPGRQYYGQILSTLGQLSSFLGLHKEAVEYFNNALEYLTKNSDPDKAERDRSQTMTYQVIAMMDAEDISNEQFDKALETYLMMPPTNAAVCHSVSTDQPYTHHVLLRAIAYRNYPDARNAYLHRRSEWCCGAYHPWELIEFYRGLMFDSAEDALPHLRNAYEIAMQGEVTMHVIGAVILGSIYLWDESVKDTYVTLVEKLAEQLPKLGTRTQVLREQVDLRRSARELAKLVLPFNFR